MLIPNARLFGAPPTPGVGWSEQIRPGWLPIEIAGMEPVVRWMKVNSFQLSDPFFSTSVERLRVGPHSARELETRLNVFVHGTAHLVPVAPAGVILHMSRCGSTLLANALRSAVRVVAVSEAASIEMMMSLASSASTYWSKMCTGLLEPLTTVFAHYLGPPAKNVVIKCSAIAIAHFEAIRRAWPTVPCIILIRNPVEVLVSNLERPGRWVQAYGAANDGSGMFGTPPASVLASGRAELPAWVIGRFCNAALAVMDERCRVINYEDLNPKSVAGIAEFFGLEFTSEGLRDFQGAFHVDAKRVDRIFKPDQQTKQSLAARG
jgi:hypothetical protein